MNFPFKKAEYWIKDYAHLLRGSAIMYLKHTAPKHYLDYTIDGKAPIVIIPGVFGRWAFLKPLADYLSLLGHPVYIVPKLGSNTDDIPSSAQKVREVIEENKLKNAVIVAHSKGGLIAKYILVHDNVDQSVKGLVAIATPFSGSEITKILPKHKVFNDLGVESLIVQDLNKHTEVNNKIISIFPSYDNHVWHNKGSLLEGALANIKVPVQGHHKVLYDKSVWVEVENAVNKISIL